MIRGSGILARQLICAASQARGSLPASGQVLRSLQPRFNADDGFLTAVQQQWGSGSWAVRGLSSSAQCAEEKEFEVKEGDVDEPPSAEEVEAFRSEHKFMRRSDGRVQLKGSDGAVWDVKLDMRVAGALLLRNRSDNHVFYIVADELKQIDLSSDQVVAQLFKDGQWEAAAAPLYFGQDTPMKHVKTQGSQFHYLVTLLSEGGPAPDA